MNRIISTSDNEMKIPGVALATTIKVHAGSGCAKKVGSMS